jgi:tetratricopeptide (TPR) repeat protein
MTRISRACGLMIVYCVLAALLGCGIAAAQEINEDFTEGVRLFQERSYNAAIQRLEAAVEAEPANEAAWYYLGVARYQQNNPEEALEALQRAYELAPGRPGTEFYIGQIYERLGAWDEAILAYQTELRNRRLKNLAEVFAALGRAYYFSGRYVEALDNLSQALEHDENFVEALFYRGLARFMREEYEQAEDDFVEATDILTEWDRNRRSLDSMIEREGLGMLPPESQRRKQELQEELAQDYARAAEFAQEKFLRPALYLALGDTRVALSEYSSARNSYRKALNADLGGNPADPLPQVKVGEAYFEEAKDMFYNRGLLWNAITTVDEGIYAVEDALANDEAYPDAHKALGDMFLFQASTYVSDPERDVVSSTYEEALARYDAAIEVAPDYVEAYEGRAQVHIAMDDPASAISDLQSALDIDPRNADAYAAMAMALMLQEDYEEAIRTAQLALNLDPENAQAQNAAGMAFYYLGQLGAASQHFMDAVKADPTLHQSYTNLGNTFYQMGSWPRARAQYEEALERIPTPAIANTAVQRSYLYYLIARTYHFSGMYDAEIEALGQALALDSAYLEALVQLASAYSELGQFQAAEQALMNALEVSPGPEEDAAIHVQMGQLYEREGRPYEAITAYGAALAAEAENAEAREALNRLTAG